MISILNEAPALIRLLTILGVCLAVFGLVGIASQVVMMRMATVVMGIDMEALFHSEEFGYHALMVAAAQFALGIVVSVAIL